jgi:superfamily II RNA helicase
MKKNDFPLNIGLSEEEKKDLEQMIGEFQQNRSHSEGEPDLVDLQNQIDALSKRLAYLTTMFLSIDRRMQPLYATVRLTYQKSEILNQRIHAIIDSLRSGEAL